MLPITLSKQCICSVLDRLSAYTNYRHPTVPITGSFTYAEIYRNTRRSHTCFTHALPAPFPRPFRALNSCSPAVFALILVGYITQQFLILLSVSHIFAIFPVNCHAAQEEEAKIKVGPSSCTCREDWTK